MYRRCGSVQPLKEALVRPHEASAKTPEKTLRAKVPTRITVFISYAQARTHKNICDVNEALQKIAVDEELMLHDAEASQAEKRIA